MADGAAANDAPNAAAVASAIVPLRRRVFFIERAFLISQRIFSEWV